MRRVTSSPRTALPGLLGVLVVSVVLGIVGMHALNTHGVMGAEHSTVTTTMTGAHADMATAPVTGDPAGLTAHTSSTAHGGDGPSLGSMVMLCFAMLVATAGALLLLFVGLRRRSRAGIHRPTVHTTAATRVTARLGSGPPYVWQFSVNRC